MIYQVQLHPLAKLEIDESYQWYEERMEGLGNRFLNALQNSFDQVAAQPALYAKKKGSYREILVQGFPFIIIYEMLSKQKIVFVSYIFHTKRNPGLKYKR